MYTQVPLSVSHKKHFISDGVENGYVKAEWLSDGRSMELLGDFAFVDDTGAMWFAPKGSVVDGASIPQWLWPFIGGPFEGKYREASVVHDVYCQTKTLPSWRVHIMFYQAMRVRNVPWHKAVMMYLAVRYIGGPKFPGIYEDLPEVQPTPPAVSPEKQVVVVLPDGNLVGNLPTPSTPPVIPPDKR